MRLRWDHAICAHGGLILGPGGAPNSEWQSRIAALADDHADALGELARTLGDIAPNQVTVRLLEEDGLPLYVLAKQRSDDPSPLEELVSSARSAHIPPGWTVHHNGTNAAFLPPFLGKRSAVDFLLPKLREAHPDLPAIGIGDSLTDGGFMQLCDFAMAPEGSQLARAWWTAEQ